MRKISLQNLPEFVAGDNSILKEYFNPEKTAMNSVSYSLAHATVPSGTITLKHTLKSSEVYYVLKGTGIMHIDGETFEINPLDAVHIPPGCVQYVENNSDQDLTFLCIVEPAWTPDCETVLR